MNYYKILKNKFLKLQIYLLISFKLIDVFIYICVDILHDSIYLNILRFRDDIMK